MLFQSRSSLVNEIAPQDIEMNDAKRPCTGSKFYWRYWTLSTIYTIINHTLNINT